MSLRYKYILLTLFTLIVLMVTHSAAWYAPSSWIKKGAIIKPQFIKENFDTLYSLLENLKNRQMTPIQKLDVFTIRPGQSKNIDLNWDLIDIKTYAGYAVLINQGGTVKISGNWGVVSPIPNGDIVTSQQKCYGYFLCIKKNANDTLYIQNINPFFVFHIFISKF